MGKENQSNPTLFIKAWFVWLPCLISIKTGLMESIVFLDSSERQRISCNFDVLKLCFCRCKRCGSITEAFYVSVCCFWNRKKTSPQHDLGTYSIPSHTRRVHRRLPPYHLLFSSAVHPSAKKKQRKVCTIISKIKKTPSTTNHDITWGIAMPLAPLGSASEPRPSWTSFADVNPPKSGFANISANDKKAENLNDNQFELLSWPRGPPNPSSTHGRPLLFSPCHQVMRRLWPRLNTRGAAGHVSISRCQHQNFFFLEERGRERKAIST